MTEESATDKEITEEGREKANTTRIIVFPFSSV
jgi:hypothetical protein